jgi:hypothetical protein
MTALSLFFIAFILFWGLLPSRNYHADGLDELQRIENGNIIYSPKHFGAEPALRTLYKILTKLGFQGRAIRPVQIWNGFWITVFLFFTALLILRSGHSWPAALVFLLLISGWYAVMHLALDPYLYYLPPSLALSAGAFTLLRLRTFSPEKVWWGLLILLTAMAAFNPVLLLTAPLLAWEWHHFQHTGKKTIVLSGLWRAAGLVIFPAALFTAAMAVFGQFDLSRGPYGKLTSLTPHLAWKGLTGAFTAMEQGQNIFRVFSGNGEPVIWAAVIVHLLTPLIIICAGISLLFNRGRINIRLFIPWAATAAAAFLFVVWYDPPQVRFWIFPLWLTTMIWIINNSRPIKRSSTENSVQRGLYFAVIVLICMQAVLLWISNVSSYAWPAAHEPNRRIIFVEQLKNTFASTDTLLFPIYYDPYIEYFGEGLHSWSMVFLYRKTPEGFDTFDFLDRFIQRTQAKGGHVYMQMPPPGQPWVTQFIKKRFGVDYADEDFQRLRFGETKEVRGRIFRELLFVTGNHMRPVQ